MAAPLAVSSRITTEGSLLSTDVSVSSMGVLLDVVGRSTSSTSGALLRLSHASRALPAADIAFTNPLLPPAAPRAATSLTPSHNSSPLGRPATATPVMPPASFSTTSRYGNVVTARIAKAISLDLFFAPMRSFVIRVRFFVSTTTASPSFSIAFVSFAGTAVSLASETKFVELSEPTSPAEIGFSSSFSSSTMSASSSVVAFISGLTGISSTIFVVSETCSISAPDLDASAGESSSESFSLTTTESSTSLTFV